MNVLSHRAEHASAASRLVALADVPPTGEEFAAVRHVVARSRRHEQRQARIAAGTDRATIRASR